MTYVLCTSTVCPTAYHSLSKKSYHFKYATELTSAFYRWDRSRYGRVNFKLLPSWVGPPARSLLPAQFRNFACVYGCVSWYRKCWLHAPGISIGPDQLLRCYVWKPPMGSFLVRISFIYHSPCTCAVGYLMWYVYDCDWLVVSWLQPFLLWRHEYPSVYSALGTSVLLRHVSIVNYNNYSTFSDYLFFYRTWGSTGKEVELSSFWIEGKCSVLV